MMYRPGDKMELPRKQAVADRFVHEAASQNFGAELVALWGAEPRQVEAHLKAAAMELGVKPEVFLAYVAKRIEAGHYPERQLRCIAQPLRRLLDSTVSREDSAELVALRNDLAQLTLAVA